MLVKGNLVSVGDKIVEIDTVHGDFITFRHQNGKLNPYIHVKQIKFIEPTPELFWDLGFTCYGNIWKICCNNGIDLCINGNVVYLEFLSIGYVDLPYIKHVHEIQNLFETLGGERLKYKKNN